MRAPADPAPSGVLDPLLGAEAELRAVGLRGAVWRVDLGRGQFLATPGWAALLGEPEAPVSWTVEQWLARVHEDDRPALELALRTCVEGLSPGLNTECRMKHRMGFLRWMRVRGRPEGEPGPEGAVRGHQEDVTEAREQQLLAEEAAQCFRGLVDACPDAVAVHREGRLLYANARLASLLGEPRAGDLVGRLLLEIIHADDASRVAADLRRLAGGEVDTLPPMEYRLRRRDGGELEAEVCSIVATFDGEAAVFSVMRDISERKRVQARLAHTDRMASLGTLAAGVAHEINNPLMFVTVNLQSVLEDMPQLAQWLEGLRGRLAARLGEQAARELLADLGGTPEQASVEDIVARLNDAHEGSQRVKSIVADLRSFTRLDEQLRGPVALERVVEMALKMTRHETRHRAQVAIEAGDVPLAQGDGGRLCQVLINLVVNAAQAMEEDDPERNRITIRLRADGDLVIAEVADNGPGIPPEDLARIFDPFFTTKPPGVGSGLGLAICRHVVEASGGRVEVDSTPGEGTTVRVCLRRYEEGQGQEAPQPSAEGEAEQEEKAPSAAPKPRILIIDDEPTLLRTLTRALGGEYDVTALSAEPALALLDQRRDFDLILCDVIMPGCPGHRVYQWLEDNAPELVPRTVFITGGATTRGAREFLERIENVVVEKPIDVGNLRRLLRRLLASPTEEPTPEARARERRRGDRMPAPDICGVVSTGDRFVEVTVVDYSHSGVRVEPLRNGRPLSWDDRAPASLMLRRRSAGESVSADVRYVRAAAADAGAQPCFEIVGMSPASRGVYERWLGRGERRGGGALRSPGKRS